MITSIYRRYEGASLATFKTPTPSHAEALEFVKSWLASPTDQNIIIIGGVGTGKTHLAYAMVAELSTIREVTRVTKYWDSKKIQMVSMKSIIDEIKAGFNGKTDNGIADLSKCPILIVDEIGLQYGSDMERIELFELFNLRYNRCLPTVCLSNLDQMAITKVMGMRIADRLFGGAKVITLGGESMRKDAPKALVDDTKICDEEWHEAIKRYIISSRTWDKKRYGGEPDTTYNQIPDHILVKYGYGSALYVNQADA